MSTSDIKLIVTDMDGTLLDADHRLPEHFAEVVNDLKTRGIHWAIASGRQLANLQAQFAPLGISLDILAENGSLVQLGEESTPFFRDLTPATFFESILTAAAEIPLTTPVLCGADCAWVKDLYPEHRACVNTYFAKTVLWSAFEEVRNCELCKIAFYHPEAATQLHPHLAPFESDDLRVILSSPCWVDVQPRRIHKGNGLQALLHRRNLRPEQAVVFGDYLNDVEMMTMGTHSVAMANAHPELAKACLHTTRANTEDGVLFYLRQLGLLP